MNPPYGRAIAAFLRKAHEESLSGATVVCLVPSRTDTAWWHRYARQGQIIFLRGRLRFGEARASAPFPSAIVIFWGGRLGNAIRSQQESQQMEPYRIQKLSTATSTGEAEWIDVYSTQTLADLCAYMLRENDEAAAGNYRVWHPGATEPETFSVA